MFKKAAFLGALVLSAVPAGSPSAAQDQPPASPQPGAMISIRGQLDLSGLNRAGVSSLPAGSSEYSFGEVFARWNLERILPQGEFFGPLVWQGDEARTISPNFVCEVRPESESLLLTLRDDVEVRRPDPVPGGENALMADARARLEILGLPEGETSRAFLRRLRRASRSVGSNETEVRVIGTKVFVNRMLGDAAVLGSRIVLSYDADGSFRKLLGHWPTLAESGHRLSTELTTSQVANEVARTLAVRPIGSIPSGPISLRYVYLAEPHDDGGVVLALQVEATLPLSAADRNGSGAGMVRQVLVSLPR